VSKKCIAGIAANIPTDPSMSMNIDRAIHQAEKPEKPEEALNQFEEEFNMDVGVLITRIR